MINKGKVTILKKVLSIILAAVIFASVMSVSVFAETTETTENTQTTTEYQMPDDVQTIITKMQNLDANKNGTYETGDVTKVLSAAAGIVPADQVMAYDINNDGVVSVKDAQKALNVIAGVDTLFTKEQLFKVFNERVNSVKKVFPGFTKRETLDCSSILVTTKNAPLDDLNVTNIEYNAYVAKLVKLMNTFPYSLALNASMKAELEKMQKAADEAYDEQRRSTAVGKGKTQETAHYNNYPVSNFMWASNLTISDIYSINYTMSGYRIVFTLKMKNYSYKGDDCPTSLEEKAKTPYGKVFNLPELSETDGSVVNSLDLRDGEIILQIDYKTSDCLKAEYYYEYCADVKAPKDPESDLEMTTNTTAEMKESYVFYRVTQV